MRYLLLLLLCSCGTGEDKPVIKILSKTHLTDSTAFYVIEHNGTRLFVVNGIDKVAICR